MRSFNIDWSDLAGMMPLWRSLGEYTHRRLLKMKATDVLHVNKLNEGDAQKLAEHGVMNFTQEKRRMRIAAAGRGPLKALRAMYRIDLYEEKASHARLRKYIRETLTGDESSALLSSPHRGGYRYARLEEAFRKSWLDSWLEHDDAASARRWETGRLPQRSPGSQFEDGSPYFDDAELFRATRRLVREAMTWEKPVALDELPDRLPDLDAELLWRALTPAIRYLLLFPRLEEDTLLPIIGLWPGISWLLQRPEAKPPEPVEPGDTFHSPYRVEDVTALLVAAAASPLRMLASKEGLYQKEYARIGEAMSSVADWLINKHDEDFVDLRSHADDALLKYRVEEALILCVEEGLLEPTRIDKRRKPASYEIADAGRKWLELDLKQQIKRIIDPLRAAGFTEADDEANQFEDNQSSLIVQLDDYGGFYFGEPTIASPWMPPSLQWYDAPAMRKIDWRTAIVDALSDPADAHFRPVGPWMEYQSRVNNPLLGTRRRGGDYGPAPDLSGRYIGQLDETMIEQVWAESLLHCINDLLLPVGGVELGFDGEQRCVRLHDIGRYTLGLIDDFQYEAATGGDVIVQPDFEVLFMGPAPAAEARIAPLAERTGQRMGTMFRLTRKSVQDAAAMGITKSRAQADLESISARPLPDNVRRQVSDWFDATASVKLREAWLVDAPDAETADRVETAAGKHVRRLAPTTLEVTVTKSSQSALRRKLKDAGVFVM